MTICMLDEYNELLASLYNKIRHGIKFSNALLSGMN